MAMKRCLLATAVAMLMLWLGAATAQEVGPAPESEPPGKAAQVALTVPEGARAGKDFDVDRATRAWLDTMTAEEKARSDAYFEGGYWLQLWGFLYGLGVAALLLFTRLSAWLRERTRWSRWPSINAGFYGAGYIVAATLLFLPWGLYTGWFREHQYDLSNLTLLEWLVEWGKGLGVSVVMGVIALTLLYAVLRRVRQAWWIWATVASVAFCAVMLTLQPVFVEPIFNDYEPLPEGEIRSEILSLARANDIPADNVYWFNASKQHSRISANVAGFGPTTRIALNDNLLKHSSQAGIEAVMGHEMGHYALNHVNRLLIEFGLVILFGFAFVAWGFRRLVARYGDRWDVHGIEDPAGFPVIVALFTVFFFVSTPVTNTIVRAGEMEADLYGLNAARQPDGFAETAMKLSSYRKIQPHWLEEIIFYDHPSGYTRVRTAMQWKAENLEPFEGSDVGSAP
jgi:STE24 endopeptidase